METNEHGFQDMEASGDLMTVIELARLAGVTADAVRYYARVGLLSPKRNAANGYREFSAFDVRRLRFIKRV
jgi:DNA-binding transcriptional MerR regulator